MAERTSESGVTSPDPQQQTPRCDARIEFVQWSTGDPEPYVPADFARQLEQEIRAYETSERERIVQLEQRLAAAEQSAEKWRKVDAPAFVLTAKLTMLNTLDLSGREVLLRSDVMDLVYRWRTDHDAALKERHE